MEENLNEFGEERRSHSKEDFHSYLDRKSAFRIDFRQRIDLLAKSILLFTGGALTISMGVFLKKDAPSIDLQTFQELRISWYLLLSTIVLLSIALYVMIIQGYYINKNWDGKVPLGDDQISGNKAMKWFRWGIAIIGTLGFATFLGGIAFLGMVSINVVKFGNG